MDDMEDDARYPAKPYAINPYNLSNRSRKPVRNSTFYHPINRYEVEDEEEEEENDDEFCEENNQQEDEDDEEDESPNGYYRNFEEDGDFGRHPKKRKLRNLISRYQVEPRGAAKASYVTRNSKAEWTEHAVFVLLEMWGDRFLQLGRRSLRSEDWNDVAEKVSEASKMDRTEVQCRTMLDKLKRKYKKEKARVEEMGLNSSKWVYFKKMDMLMGVSPRQDHGLACGIDSGEYVFMNTWVYLERSNGFDEMRDSPGESENEDEKEDEPPPRRMLKGGGEGSSSYRVLADSIQKFGEIYEKIESSKRQQMMELEKMRLEFQRELELQKKQILERAQAEIAKMQEEDDDEDEEDSDASEENLSE